MDLWTIGIWIAIVGGLLRIGRRAAGALGRSSEVMASLFVPPDRALGWPQGVQESDDPWGWRNASVSPSVPTSHVGPSTAGRRRGRD